MIFHNIIVPMDQYETPKLYLSVQRFALDLFGIDTELHSHTLALLKKTLLVMHD